MRLDQNSVVWASAGTGKTYKLVQTYLALVEDGADPLRIVAVTFTEKAAAEMRDRIRSAIYDRLEKDPAEQRSRWMRVLSVLPAAPISTIHGFCGLILRENGLRRGIDPSFSILDEQRSLDLARESAVETIRSEIRSGDESVSRLFGDFGLEKLVESIVSAGYWVNTLGEHAGWLNRRVDDQAKAAIEVRSAVAEHIDKYAGDFEALGSAVDELDARKAKHALKKRDDSRAALPRIGQIAGVEVSRQLSRLVALSSERFVAKKSALKALDFDDLLLHTRDLLAGDAGVLDHYREHFQVLLVDEFQDTDEVQAAIVKLLATDPSDRERFAPGRLMIVGDPKQSIYRFRRARVTVFFRILNEILRDGGKLEHLQENRRSAPPIAEFANRLCEHMMDAQGKGPMDDPQVDLSYRIRFSESDRLVAVADVPFAGITYVAAEADARAATGRLMEAEALARLLRKWKTNGTIQSWKEVAMLFRATSNMALYVQALDKHAVPVYVVQGTHFYQKTEVSDLIALLETILHPEDPLLRATVLSSSLAGFTFGDLLEKPDTGRFDAIIQPWIERRDSATAAEILEDVIRKTNFDVVMTAQRNGAQRVANIGKLIEITRELARQGATALDEVVRHLRDRALDLTVREAEAQTVAEDEDVVRILTVHQAKGLEFDIVVVPDLAAKTSRSSGDRTVFSDRWGVLAGASYGLHRRALPHALILEAKGQDEDQQFEEEKRLLYVAVTRAKKMLVLGEGFAKQGGPWVKWVQKLLDDIQPGAIQRAREGSPAKIRCRGRRGIPDFVIDVIPASLLNLPEQLQFEADAAMIGSDAVESQLAAEQRRLSRPLPLPVTSLDLTPSDLAALAGCSRHFQWTRILGIAEPGTSNLNSNTGAPQMHLGSIAHRILETGARPDRDVLARDGLQELEAVFDSQEWLSLMAENPEPELPFIMHVQAAGRDCWVRGRMDVVVAAEVPRVIDYKFSGWREDTELAYDVQLTAYCLALMKTFETDRAVGELWYLKNPMKIVRREYRREVAEQRLARLIEQYIQAVETDTWPRAERPYCDSVSCGFRDRCWMPTPDVATAG